MSKKTHPYYYSLLIDVKGWRKKQNHTDPIIISSNYNKEWCIIRRRGILESINEETAVVFGISGF